MSSWSPQQDAALKDVDRWLQDPGGQQVFRLFGYAGTGKTTLARHLAEMTDGTVLFCAYTGKAAHVLREKGCEGASTIHSLIYLPREKSRLRLRALEVELARLDDDQVQEAEDLRRRIDAERKNLARPAFTLNPDSDASLASLIILDECSMVDARIGQDLLSFEKPILVLGDPAQLPPVMGAGFFTAHEPDVMLTEIHRQARDNPILRMATAARSGERLDLGDYGEDCRVVDREWMTPEYAMSVDQILVGRNRTRRAVNARIRGLRDFDGQYPISGDKLVCLRNDHDIGLLNGSLWKVAESIAADGDRIYVSVSPEDGGEDLLHVEAHTYPFDSPNRQPTWWERREAQEFDYGYALTVHKAQGSQWNRVLLFDESGAFRADRHRWLYTGLTRAAHTITVVRV